VASASSIICLSDFSLALVRHSSSSFCFRSTCFSNSLSLCSSALLAFKVFGSWGPSFSRLWSSPVADGSSSVVLMLYYLVYL
jgi:hypothetical protein